MTKIDVKRFLLLDRTPRQTWDLLTEKSHLEKWFCNYAHIEPRPGGAFHFLGGVSGGQVQSQFSVFEKYEMLDFEWKIFAEPTHVRWVLEPQLNMTRLIVNHSAISTERVAFTNFAGHAENAMKDKVCIEDIWWNSLARLKYYVETGQEPHKADLTIRPSEKVVQSILVNVSADQAYAALTVGSHLDAWMGQNSNPHLTVGEKFDIGWKDGPQQVTECIPKEKIAYDWTYQNEPKTHVEWTVESIGNKARITIVHSGFGNIPATFNDYNRGWAGFLVRLALYLEKGISAHGWTGEIK